MKKQVIIIAGVIAAVALLIVGFLFYQNRKNKTGKTDIDSTVFQVPEGFEWDGSYIDSLEGYAVLTIEKSDKSYLCSVAVPTTDVSYVQTYVFEAKKSADGNSLEYTGGVHTEYLIPETGSESPVTTTEVYADGSGSIYYYDGYIFWLDDKEGAGAKYAFRKQEIGTAADEAESGGE